MSWCSDLLTNFLLTSTQFLCLFTLRLVQQEKRIGWDLNLATQSIQVYTVAIISLSAHSVIWECDIVCKWNNLQPRVGSILVWPHGFHCHQNMYTGMYLVYVYCTSIYSSRSTHTIAGPMRHLTLSSTHEWCYYPQWLIVQYAYISQVLFTLSGEKKSNIVFSYVFTILLESNLIRYIMSEHNNSD